MSIEVASDFNKKASVKNITIECTNNSNSSHSSHHSIRGYILQSLCKPCDINTYTMRNSFILLGMNKPEEFETKLKVYARSPDFQCYPCPVGGSCKNGIKSSGNFFGYEKNGEVVFTSCPKSYCCSKKECTDVQSCRVNRTGTLCGDCKKGLQEDLFSKECMEISQCKNSISFWIIFLIITFLFCVLFFLYLKDILNGTKASLLPIVNKLKEKLMSCLMCCKNKGQGRSSLPEENELSLMKEITDEAVGGVMLSKEDKGQNNEEVTFSGFLNIVVGFYQIRSLLSIEVKDTHKRSSTIQDKIEKVVNFDLNFFPSLCPWKEMTPIGEGFITKQLGIALIFGWALLILIVYVIAKNLKALFFSKCKKNTENQDSKKNSLSLRFSQRVGIGIIRIILFGYKNVATFCIVLIHCVEVEGKLVLFIHGSQQCYFGKQIVSFCFIVLWVLPFPVTLMYSFRWYMHDKKMTMMEFISCTIFPWAIFYFKFRKERVEKKKDGLKEKTENGEKSIEIQTEERIVDILLKELLEQSYRDLNNEKDQKKGYKVFWETWRLYQRLILAIVATYAINPVVRICLITPCILLYIFVYWYIQPYKKQYRILHWMEVMGLLGITFTLVNNMFRSFLYVFEIPDQKPVPESLYILWLLDTLASPIIVPVLLKIQHVVMWLYSKRDKCFNNKHD